MSNKTQLQANNETLASILSNVLGLPTQESLKHGANVWKKLTAEGGDFVDFTVSDSPTAYPDGGERDGYWYEKVVEGVAGIDFGEVTLASAATSVTVSHKLGVVPSWVALVPKILSFDVNKATYFNLNGFTLYTTLSSASHTDKNAENILNSTDITFNVYSGHNSPFKATDYYWIAIA